VNLRLLIVLVTTCAIVACAITACSSPGKRNARDALQVPLPVATGDYPMLGHAADFSWIAGRVERNLSCTYLRFGSARTTAWSGRIALVATFDQLAQLQTGDTLIIKGSLVPLSDGTCGPPSYVVSSIEEH
jgi:hypothetical protein